MGPWLVSTKPLFILHATPCTVKKYVGQMQHMEVFCHFFYL